MQRLYMHQPLVSVVMCTYNGSRFIAEQIESILNQDYSNIELLISDDASIDDTWQKLMSYQKQYPNIRTYRNETNLGYNKNFEKAIQLATGDLIALSDQDDIWMPEKISKLVNSFKDSTVVLAHNKSVRFEKGRLRFKSASLFNHFSGNDTRKLFMFNQINGHDIMFRRELVKKFLPIPDRMMYDWWIAVIATCYGKIASVNEYLVHHRIHSENSFFKKEENSKSRHMDLEEVFKLFKSIDELSVESRSFLNEFSTLLEAHNKQKTHRFDSKLFFFLLKYGKTIFGHKRRWVPQWLYLKYAFRYAKFNFNGKGIFI